MDVLPAIDLRGGKVVRLTQGDYAREKQYSDDPVAVAQSFIAAGATWIHVVDLDAARSGTLTNTDSVSAICKAARPAGVRVEVGGGLRTRGAMDSLLAVGASRLVIGSAAMKNWPWFESLLADASLPNSALALGLDARDGYLSAEGWTEQLELTAWDFAQRVNGSGLGAIIYTDIARDGMLTGPNFETTARLIGATDVPVVASGGVGVIDDVRRCRQIGCGGVIIGRAYYEGKLDLAAACAIAIE